MTPFAYLMRPRPETEPKQQPVWQSYWHLKQEKQA